MLGGLSEAILLRSVADAEVSDLARPLVGNKGCKKLPEAATWPPGLLVPSLPFMGWRNKELRFRRVVRPLLRAAVARVVPVGELVTDMTVVCTIARGGPSDCPKH